MKFTISKLRAALVLALTLFVGTQTFAGTKDGGGGGNARKSTRADLEEIVRNMPRLAWESSDIYVIGRPLRLTSKELPPPLQYVNSKITGQSYFSFNAEMVNYVSQLKFHIESECYEGTESKDASTEHRHGASICLSETRLARFPKSALRIVILPLIFHEIAHQFQFGEDEANAFQALADIHLKYQPIYLASLRALFSCAFASETLTDEQKKFVLADLPEKWAGTELLKEWPKFENDNQREGARLTCAIRATGAGENLDRVYDGDVWQVLDLKSLTKSEKDQLIAYQGYKDSDHHERQPFTYSTLEHALVEPAVSGYSSCDVCKAQKIDVYNIMMLGARGAMEHIDHEVGRLQLQVKVHDTEK